MIQSDKIKLFDGSLYDGETVEFYFDFDCDLISDKYTSKRWLVLAEKDVKYNSKNGQYYYESGKGEVQESVGDDYITVSKLVSGRLFVIFKYTDVKNRSYEYYNVFYIFPRIALDIEQPIMQDNYSDITFSTVINGISAECFFSDISGSFLGITGQQGEITFTGKNMTASRLFAYDGVYLAQIISNYRNAVHNNENNTSIVWQSNPTDKLVDVGGPLGGGTKIDADYYDITTIPFLVQKNVSGSNGIDIDIGITYQPPELIAPTDLQIVDKTTYYGMTITGAGKRHWDYNTHGAPSFGTLTTNDPSYYIPESHMYKGTNKIVGTRIDFGDGNFNKGFACNFSIPYTYKTGGDYNITYTVTTRHYITEITGYDMTSIGLSYDQTRSKYYYEQNTSKSEPINIKPFFYKWFLTHLPGKYYADKQAIKDIALSWGIQMDGLYGTTKSILESIDANSINDKFIQHYFNTYGDDDTIAKKIGLVALTENEDDRYNFFSNYNFFDRLERGVITAQERKEFLNYARTTQERLSRKGTPKSLEVAINQIGLVGLVVELWTDTFAPSTTSSLRDEVFAGNSISLNSGLDFKISSTPSSTNTEAIIATNSKSPYLEVNTINKSSFEYYLNDKEIVKIKGKKYVAIGELGVTNITAAEVIVDDRWPNDFDTWADENISDAKWLLTTGTYLGDGIISGQSIIRWSDYSSDLSLPLNRTYYWKSNKKLAIAAITDIFGTTKEFDYAVGIASISSSWQSGNLSDATALSWPWIGITEPYYYYRLITPDTRTPGYAEFKLVSGGGFSFSAPLPFTLQMADDVTNLENYPGFTGADPIYTITTTPYIIPATSPRLDFYAFDEYMRDNINYSNNNISNWKVIKGCFSAEGYSAENSKVCSVDREIQFGDLLSSICELETEYIYFYTNKPLVCGYASEQTGEPTSLEYWDGFGFLPTIGNTGGSLGRNLQGKGTHLNNCFIYRWRIPDNFERRYMYHRYKAFYFYSNVEFCLRVKGYFCNNCFCELASSSSSSSSSSSGSSSSSSSSESSSSSSSSSGSSSSSSFSSSSSSSSS